MGGGAACGDPATGDAVVLWFGEAFRWDHGTTWLGLVNPLRRPQDVRVSILGRDIVRTVRVPARGRVAEELGTWGLSGDFGIEVRCDLVCAASLTMWDGPMHVAHESVPVVGCEVR